MPVRHDRFHGRHESSDERCNWPGCGEQGEFRAPGPRPPGFDGPGDYRWLCLDHVREFNSGYDFFDGMDAEEISRAQSPLGGWDRETRAFNATAGVDSAPRWADFADPLDAIGKRARIFRKRAHAADHAQSRADGTPLTFEERRAFETLDLGVDADRKTLRKRYTELLRRYHPDHNGGDRSHEARLKSVVDAYKLLRKSSVFS